MKMTKTEFKVLMKECLSELINEGAFDKKLEQIAESKINPGTGYVPQAANSSFSQSNSGIPSAVRQRLMEAVNVATSRQSGEGKSMFQQILMDTAETTLQRQLAGEMGGGSGGLLENAPPSQAQKAAAEAQINVLSGGNPGRWAAAAFAGKKKL